MVTKQLPPTYLEKKFNCPHPHCSAYAGQVWSTLYVSTEQFHGQQFGRVVDGVGGDPGYNAFDEDTGPLENLWEVSHCSACEHYSLWIGGELAFPPGRTTGDIPVPSDDMPSEVRELYLEASAVMPYSKRAAAALCRASLERLARHLTPDMSARSSLDARLVELSLGTTGSLTKALQVMRFMGNNALHGSPASERETAQMVDSGVDGERSAVIYLDGADDDLVGFLFVTINELVYDQISRPLHIDGTYSTLPDGFRDSFERKAREAAERKGGGGTP